MTRGVRAASLSAGALALCAGGLGLFAGGPGPSDGMSAVARRGSIAALVTEAGTLRAASSITVRSPVEGRELEVRWLAPEGSVVREGDELARLDTSALRGELDRAGQMLRQAELELASATVEREEAALALAGAAEGAGALAVEEGRAELQMLQARASRLRAEHDRLRPLLARGYITRDELDRAALEAEEAETRAALGERAFRTLSERTYPASLQTARLQLAKRDSQLAHLRQKADAARSFARSLAATIEACTIRATHPGLVVYDENFSVVPRRKIRAGDRVTPSQGLITLPDLRRMSVASSVRESDVRSVATGQRVRVTLDAFPALQLEGYVAHVGALAHGSAEREGTRFDVAIALETANALLRPGMNARVDIIVAERHDVLLVPAESVFQGPGGAFVYLHGRGAVERRPVLTGLSNGVDTEVTSGLDTGDRVRLTAPAAHARR